MKYQRRSKYGNTKTERHGIMFHSEKEANRYDQLLYMQMAGEISELETQKKFHFELPDMLAMLEEQGAIQILDIDKIHAPALRYFRCNNKYGDKPTGKITSYTCDFYYYDNNTQEWVVEDTKANPQGQEHSKKRGNETDPVYLLKKATLYVFYGISIKET